MRSYLLFLLTFATFAYGADVMVSTNNNDVDDDFVIIDDIKEPVNKSFTTANGHNPKLPLDVRAGLVQKGYNLLDQIRAGVTFDLVKSDVQYFPDAGCQYIEYAQSWVHKAPTLSSIRNFCSYYTSTNEQVEEAKQNTQKRRAKLEDLIAIVWAISDYAYKNDQGFSSGSFSIDDPDGLLFNFFAQYALWVNQANSLDALPYGSLNPLNPVGSPFAYGRDPKTPIISGSSHYKNTTIHQIGIDARFESNAYTISAFPYGATHIIVGRVTTQTGLEKTMIKYEPYGTGTFSAWLAHGLEFIHSQSNRDNKRSEKDIPIALRDQFIKVVLAVNGVDLPQAQSDVVNKMLELKDKITDNQVLKGFDLSSWVNYTLHAMSNGNSTPLRNAARGFLMAIEDLYHDGIMSNDKDQKKKVFYRTGNEVVLLLGEIQG